LGFICFLCLTIAKLGTFFFPFEMAEVTKK
jgi:hypothetical protein